MSGGNDEKEKPIAFPEHLKYSGKDLRDAVDYKIDGTFIYIKKKKKWWFCGTLFFLMRDQEKRRKKKSSLQVVLFFV